MRRIGFACAAAGAALIASCGGGGTQGGPPPGFYILVSDATFSPLDLHVPPGATVTVLGDGMAHSVTSEPNPSAFRFGGVQDVAFDTGAFTSEASFTIPAGAPDGTVVSYFSSTDMERMATPNGTITVDARAEPQPAPSMMDMSGGMMGSMSGGLSRGR
jgi:hypothetical protein